MIEPHESLSAYCDRVFDRELDDANREERLVLIDIVHEIVDVFFVATSGALTPDDSRSRPAGGRIYNMEHWIDPPDLPEGLAFEYEDQFFSVWRSADQDIQDFLGHRGLSLATPGTALQLHHAWLGRSAANVAGSTLIGLLHFVDERRESAQWQEEFNRLAPLLHRSLDAHFTETLVETLKTLSKELLLAEAARSHEPFVGALLEQEARLL